MHMYRLPTIAICESSGCERYCVNVIQHQHNEHIRKLIFVFNYSADDPQRSLRSTEHTFHIIVGEFDSILHARGKEKYMLATRSYIMP